MKPIYYNNLLAKLILFGNYHTIMLFGFILTKLNELSEAVLRHEKTHQKQYVECMEIAAVPAILLSVYASLWWLLLIPAFYYLLYLGEWLISFVYHLFTDDKIGGGKVNGNAYRAGAMEMEAKLNQDNSNYLKERKWGAWIKYYGNV